MKIVYNPEDGAPITSFVCKGILLDPHFPDGYEFRNSSGLPETSNGLVQYEDEVAEAILETYQFLKELTPQQAKEITERPADPEFKCDFPGCEFATHHKVALSGHKRTHANQIAAGESELLADPAIPVAKGRQVRPNPAAGVKPGLSPEELQTRDGVDADGVEWYGGGVKVESPSEFARVKPAGKGHFEG